jgi:hypothetical protein
MRYTSLVRLPEQIRKSALQGDTSQYTPAMDFDRILPELRAEREKIDQAIAALERLEEVRGGRRRGRPSKTTTSALSGPHLVVRTRSKGLSPPACDEETPGNTSSG